MRCDTYSQTHSAVKSANQTCSIKSARAQHSGKRCECACWFFSHCASFFAGKIHWTLKIVHISREPCRRLAENAIVKHENICMHVVECAKKCQKKSADLKFIAIFIYSHKLIGWDGFERLFVPQCNGMTWDALVVINGQTDRQCISLTGCNLLPGRSQLNEPFLCDDDAVFFILLSLVRRQINYRGSDKSIAMHWSVAH